MPKEIKTALQAIAVYVLIGFFTFGWQHNRNDAYIAQCIQKEIYSTPAHCRLFLMPPFIAGVIWPAYWLSYPVAGAATLAIYLTR